MAPFAQAILDKVTFSNDPNVQFIQWDAHPQRGTLPIAAPIDTTNHRYEFNGQTIIVDIEGPPVALTRCNQNRFNFNFAHGDTVLIGDNLPNSMPVHLVFVPPIRALGSQVSATGPVASDYLAQLRIVNADTGRHEDVTTDGVLSRTRGSAPFLGVKTLNMELISEAWFDVLDHKNQGVDFLRVAINDLFYLPR